jgi:hypothetical protein
LAAGRGCYAVGQHPAGVVDMFGDMIGKMGGLEAVAAQIGMTPEQMQGLMTEISAKIGSGDTSISALAEVAAEHGVSADKLQELMGSFGGPEAIMGKLGGLFDRDGDGNPMNELGGIAKGLFG